MCSSAPDPEMWIIQGTLAWRTSPVRTGVRFNVDLTFYSLVGSGRSGGRRHRFSLGYGGPLLLLYYFSFM
ncbi:hypothetical protein HN51_061045 [Arachis hypogaea]